MRIPRSVAPPAARPWRQELVFIGDLPNHPQRMIRPNSLLKIYVAEKAAANSVVTAHCHPRSPPQGITMRNSGKPFSAAC
jgi:hypothetical protein